MIVSTIVIRVGFVMVIKMIIEFVIVDLVRGVFVVVVVVNVVAVVVVLLMFVVMVILVLLLLWLWS